MPEGAMCIFSGGKVESIGGIMGGEETGCSDDTTDVFVEAAFWNTLDIAKGGRALKINSDARYRNERGIDPAYNMQALGRCNRDDS